MRGCNLAHNSLVTNENCYFFLSSGYRICVLLFDNFKHVCNVFWSVSHPITPLIPFLLPNKFPSYFLPCLLFCYIAIFSVWDPLRLIGVACMSMDGAMYWITNNLPMVASQKQPFTANSQGRTLEPLSLSKTAWTHSFPYISSICCFLFF